MKIQMKKYTETLVAIAMLMGWTATMVAIFIDPTNRILWGGLAIISILFMNWHLSYMPIPQNPYLGSIPPKQRSAIESAINE
jgi:hypothetical protein